MDQSNSSSSSKFSSKFDEIWPKDDLKFTPFGLNLLRSCENVKKPGNVDLKELCENSTNFPVEFPINSCRIMSQPKDRMDSIEKEANSAYPLIHERVLRLYLRFLEHKRKYGTCSEKELYSNMSLIDFIQRLLEKRCISFLGKNDRYLLISREFGFSGFQEIGTDKEKSPLLLQNVLSYDEIKLSALLSISSYTEFINDGNRNNCGEIKTKNAIENYGCIIGIVGARLTRRHFMEFQDIIVSKMQNTLENGYGEQANNDDDSDDGGGSKSISKNVNYRKVWNEFYDETMPLYKDCSINGKEYDEARNKDDIFNNVVMKKRYTITFDTLLLDSENRAKESNKRGYIHVVGIGLGVWCIAKQQEEIFLRTFAQRIKVLGPKLKHISFIHFSWFKLTECGDIKNNAFFEIDDHPDGGIRIFVSKRNPADKLRGPEFDNCLLIVSYAWDGNAMPGNEFWLGMLSSTGDPAAACSTLITEIHNPHINKTKICGENLHIASDKYGILHISDFVKNILQQN